MASRSMSEAGLAPILTVLSLLASGGVLVGGFFVAQTFYDEGGKGAPDVGVWADESQDRLLVVSGEKGADWQGLELKTDRPARATLLGKASLTEGTLSPGSKFVVLSETSQSVVGGDALSICAVAKEGPMEVTLRDAATKAIVFEQTLNVAACDRGNGHADPTQDALASATASAEDKGGKGSGKGKP